jgi:hypothetical protein
MNYSYTQDEQGSQQSRPYVIQFGGPPPQPSIEDQVKISQAMAEDLARARLRNLHAQARNMETKVLLDGMNEIRNAIQMAEVAEGDTGSTDRPPLTPAFDDINRGKLQMAYLRMVENYCNYSENMLTKQLDVKLTHEIKK